MPFMIKGLIFFSEPLYPFLLEDVIEGFTAELKSSLDVTLKIVILKSLMINLGKLGQIYQ